MSVTEKASLRCQVWIKKTNTSELPFRRRKDLNDVKTRGPFNPWDKSSGYSVWNVQLFSDSKLSKFHRFC